MSCVICGSKEHDATTAGCPDRLDPNVRLGSLPNCKSFLSMGHVVEIKSRRFIVVGLERRSVRLRLLRREP